MALSGSPHLGLPLRLAPSPSASTPATSPAPALRHLLSSFSFPSFGLFGFLVAVSLFRLPQQQDDQEADHTHELHQLHSVIDNERCRDAIQKLVVLLEQLKDLEGHESGLESDLLVCKEEISNLSRTKCGSINLDNRLIDSTNKLNLLKGMHAQNMRGFRS